MDGIGWGGIGMGIGMGGGDGMDGTGLGLDKKGWTDGLDRVVDWVGLD